MWNFSVRNVQIAELNPTEVTQGKALKINNQNLVATNAVDRDLSTIAATSTNDGTGWLKLEFEKTCFIHKVLFYYRFFTNWYNPSAGCVQSEDRFQRCVDNDNNVDVSVYQGEVKQKSCGILQLTYGLEQSDQIYTLICNGRGDTLKLSKTTGVIGVSEVVVTTSGNCSFL